MANKKSITIKKGKGQAARLSTQHLKEGGSVGIFGKAAKVHDATIREVIKEVLLLLKQDFPNFTFRTRASIHKQEIHKRLHLIDPRLGVKLFVSSASIQPDGGVTEVLDQKGRWRIILIGESKHQGNDVQAITNGYRTPAMEKKDQYIMPAGNAIERAHKNIQEMKNLMLGENHFPYVIFLQGSNFAIEARMLRWPNGKIIPILPSDSNINRIDRVTAANYGREINKNYCKNIFIKLPYGKVMLQAASIYAQCDLFNPHQMFDILWNMAITSLKVLAEELPPTTSLK